MPVFKQAQPVIPQWKELVEQLAAELNPAIRPSEQPLTAENSPSIYEDEIPQAQAIHVIVVWDKWSAVPRAARSAIILDAYELADAEKRKRIRFPVGLSFEEAVAGGYLPYRIELAFRPHDNLDRNALVAAMVREGGRRTGTGLELRFPYKALADDSLCRLRKQFGEDALTIRTDTGPDRFSTAL